MLCFLDKLLNQ